MWPGFDSGPVPHVRWVCCWFSPCSEGFSPSSTVFLPPQKPSSPNSNSTRIEDPHENQLRLMWLPLSLIYFYLIVQSVSRPCCCCCCCFQLIIIAIALLFSTLVSQLLFRAFIRCRIYVEQYVAYLPSYTIIRSRFDLLRSTSRWSVWRTNKELHWIYRERNQRKGNN